ncbi:MAG: hypothetical protein IJJ72_06545 [Bacteroidales bacterium]|nr:hypothetical protein [Bacteroidales bacterium]
MGRVKSIIVIVISLLFVWGCDTNHKSEFYHIKRDDIQGFEEFIKKYPTSSYVQDARERIETAKEEKRLREERERIEAENRRLESLYGDNSLSNGAQPYSRWYGENQYYDDYTPHSEIIVKAPYNSDVIAIVRYNNMNGSVAGHRYIKAGNTAKVYLENGYNYQTFFYYGRGWYPDKQMNDKVRGGFLKGEAFSKDGSPSYLENQILTYELTLQENGNFQTSTSSKGEMF